MYKCTGAIRYVRNDSLYRVLKIRLIFGEVKSRAIKFHPSVRNPTLNGLRYYNVIIGRAQKLPLAIIALGEIIIPSSKFSSINPSRANFLDLDRKKVSPRYCFLSMKCYAACFLIIAVAISTFLILVNNLDKTQKWYFVTNIINKREKETATNKKQTAK